MDPDPLQDFSAEDMPLVATRLHEDGRIIKLCISNRFDHTKGDLEIVGRGNTGLKGLYVPEDRKGVLPPKSGFTQPLSEASISLTSHLVDGIPSS